MSVAAGSGLQLEWPAEQCPGLSQSTLSPGCSREAQAPRAGTSWKEEGNGESTAAPGIRTEDLAKDTGMDFVTLIVARR